MGSLNGMVVQITNHAHTAIHSYTRQVNALNFIEHVNKMHTHVCENHSFEFICAFYVNEEELIWHYLNQTSRKK